MECATEDECATDLHVGFQGNNPLHEGPHLLGRPGRAGALALDGVRGQQVVTHGYSSVLAGRSRAHTDYEGDWPTRTRHGKNSPERSLPRRRQRRREHASGGAAHELPLPTIGSHEHSASRDP
jgi:hypothetical protein